MYNTTFLNESNEDKNLIHTGLRHLESRKEDLDFFLNFHTKEIQEAYQWAKDNGESTVQKAIIQCIKEHRLSKTDEVHTLESEDVNYTIYERFHNYGLSFEYVERDEENDKEPYFRYLLSYGGPSDEVRFYQDGFIEYVYLDWFCGVGFDVSHDEVFQSLREYFEDCEMLNFEEKEEAYY